MNTVIQVALPSHQSKSIFDYKVSVQCTIGDLVIVPFRKKELVGVVWSKNKSEIDDDKLKEVKEVIPHISFHPNQIKFFQFFSDYNITNLGSVLNLAIATNEFPYLDLARDNFKFNLPQLNEEQAKALQSISSGLGSYNVTLLEGVTGSGKTEVYSHAIAKILANPGGQVLVLMPEIMLTHQFVDRFKERFGEEPYVWHSKISKKNKRELWNLIACGKARFIIGARSALLLPFKQLDLIVLDEEHDTSYKQEEGIIYNARDMAVAYSYFNNRPIILSSATPAIETLHNISLKKYAKVNLSSRYGSNTMPNITIVDMSKEKLKAKEWISQVLRDKITNTLSKKEQIMLFLNRRGYAPITLCKLCGHKEKCANCDAHLVTHKAKNKLACHYCGYSKEINNTCSGCQSVNSLINCGPGVERIEEEVKKLWPEARVSVVTRDTVDAGSAESVLEAILDQQVDIIIGTQILSKGYHFPHLNLVGIIDADIGLIGVDLRAAERTYQLLNQVSGRAGRESKGEVVIQTYYPDNEILQSLKKNDKQQFYQSEMMMRKLANMPPFKKLSAIILSSSDASKVKKVANDLAKAAPFVKEITVLGPVPAPIALLRGRHRYRFLIKSAPNIKVQSFIKAWLGSIKIPGSVRLKVDIDPYSFL